MDIKELESMNLYDIHAKILLLQSGILSFDDWRKDMLAWARWRKAQREQKERANDIARQGSEDRQGKVS